MLSLLLTQLLLPPPLLWMQMTYTSCKKPRSHATLTDIPEVSVVVCGTIVHDGPLGPSLQLPA